MQSTESPSEKIDIDVLKAACSQILENYKRAGIQQIAFDRRLLANLKQSAPSPASTVVREAAKPAQAASLSSAPAPSPVKPSTQTSSPAVAPSTSLPAASSDSAKPQDKNVATAGTKPSNTPGTIPSNPVVVANEVKSKIFDPNERLNLEQRAQAFEELNAKVCNCKLCPELVRSRKQTVFGVGNLTPKIVFFGEAPGADEDRQGEPFVGKAGQLLDKIIAASKLKREEVYIMNSLKCRPPNNRTPTDPEIENCRPFFERQLSVLKPEFIVCLGAVAVRAVLNSKQSVGSLRGRFHHAFGAQVMVTYHPSYLLRTESAKKYTWEDMKMLMRELGVQL